MPSSAQLQAHGQENLQEALAEASDASQRRGIHRRNPRTVTVELHATGWPWISDDSAWLLMILMMFANFRPQKVVVVGWKVAAWKTIPGGYTQQQSSCPLH